MRNIKHPADAALWLILLASLCVCTCIVLLTVANQLAFLASMSDGMHLSKFAKESPTFKIITYEAAPFLLMITAVLLTERPLRRGRIPTRIYSFLLCASLLAFGWSFLWFQHPMHEIAMYFGSHGRWGCGVVNADGSYYYIFRDATVPWMIFPPMIVVFITHWIWSRKHERTEQSVPAYGAHGAPSAEP